MMNTPSPPPSAILIPPNRLTVFQPGVTYNGVTGNGGGIPSRPTVFTTLTPKGSSTVTISIASPAVISWTAHPFVAGDAFVLWTTGALPTGVTQGLQYFVISSGLTANSFEFSTSSGGAAVNSSGTQSGTHTAFADDTAQIQTAIAACTSGETIALGSSGNPTFTITGGGININRSNITLRGLGTGPGSAIVSGSLGPATAAGTYTALWKADSTTFGGSSPFGLMYANQFAGHFTDNGISIALTSDAVKGSNSCQVASTTGLSVGQLVLIDHNTDNDPNVYWGVPGGNQDGPGASFIGSISGTSLTVNSYNSSISPLAPAWGPNAGLLQSGVQVFYSGGLAGTIASGSGLSWTLTSVGPTVTNGYMESAGGGGTRRFFCRQDRSSSQMMKISAVNAITNTVTFETVFHITHPAALAAQLCYILVDTEVTGVGIENMYLYGGTGGDGNGNLTFSFCSYSWAKNVESHYSGGENIGLYFCYRCEVRDSYMHETPNPAPGGGGYLSGLNSATADSLYENNIMWCGDKVIVMRATGGGNVVAYNYMDDAFGNTFPMSPEAGINAAHFTTSHFELLEGNYSHQFKGDSFWGSSIYITVFRNWLTGLRAANNVHTNFQATQFPTSAATAAGNAVLTFPSPNPVTGYTVATDGVIASQQLVTNVTHPTTIPAGTRVLSVASTTVTMTNNATGAGVSSGDQILFTFDGTLNIYEFQGAGVTYPYIDSWGRSCCDIQANSYSNNIAGNVLGYNGQGYLGFNGFNQDPAHGGAGFVYENLGPTFPATGSDIEMYTIGQEQSSLGTTWVLNQDATILRQGNWDWFTSSQRWHGIGGAVGTGQVCPIPNSYYLTSAPAFWGATPWPWVDPNNGNTFTLPAKARFETLTGVTTPIPPGNQ